MATINKFNKFMLTQMNGGADTTGGATAGAARVVDFDSDTIKAMLVTAAYVPSYTGHAVKASVTNEVTGAGYTAGGQALTGLSVVDSNGKITFDANDLTWAQNAAGFANARRLVIYKDTGSAATSTLIGDIDFGADKGNVAGDLIIQFSNTDGILFWQ